MDTLSKAIISANAEIRRVLARRQRQKENGHPFGCPFLFGADDEARTRYLHLGKVALYQMSYIRISLQRGVL